METENRQIRAGRRVFCGFFCVTVLLCLLCVCGCKKKKSPANALTEPTPTRETEGFEGAAPDVVQKRLSELQGILAVQVGDRQIMMDKAMVLIYLMEVRGNYYASYYETVYGTDYWNEVCDDDGKTNRDVFKEETIDSIIRYAVLYDCAVKGKISLTEEEKKENEAYVERIKAAMTAAEAERGGFTTQGLIDACEWMMTAEKYYDRMTENLGITKESVAEHIDAAEYKEYETEYLYLPTTYYDAEYAVCREEEEVCAERRARMENYFECVKTGEEFSALLSRDVQLQSRQRLFMENGQGAEKAYAEAAKTLENGEITGPVETEYGIYIIRMKDNDCKASYEEAVDAAYEMERSAAFDAAYEVLLKKYKVQVNEDAWNGIELGKTIKLAE